jgi:hypothetical protein
MVAARTVAIDGVVNSSGYNGPYYSGLGLDPGASLTYEADLPGGSWQGVGISLGTKTPATACTSGATGAVPVPLPATINGAGGGISVKPIGPSICAGLPNLQAFNFRTYTWMPLATRTVGDVVWADLAPQFVSPDGIVVFQLSAPANASAGLNAAPLISAIAPGAGA